VQMALIWSPTHSRSCHERGVRCNDESFVKVPSWKEANYCLSWHFMKVFQVLQL
jgi:hypothetical protein